MALIAYEDWNPSLKSMQLIELADGICEEYAEQGYDLTLRQLYYQFVARDYLPNNQRSYSNLGRVIDRARKAGLLDWKYIIDRTRNLMGFNTVENPGELIAQQQWRYHLDLWEGQPERVEVWVEKEALAGVIARTANRYGVDYFSCRGYVSQSELHAAAQRHQSYEDEGQQVTVIHLGDHDPSGIDMTRDVQHRLQLFCAATTVERIALNWEQIDQYNPPPNPAKLTDSRAQGYIEEFGGSSWELDALDPDTLDGLIREAIERHMDREKFEARKRLQAAGRTQLRVMAQRWPEASRYVAGLEAGE